MKFITVMAVVLYCITTFGVAFNIVEPQSEVGHVAIVPGPQECISHELTTIANNDNSPDKQWGLSTIMAPQAWQITPAGSDVIVAVLDTGINQTHEALDGKVVSSINFTQSSTEDDLHGHGTHIAGIIAATADNTIGITGVAHDCSVMNVKVVEDDGSCDSSTVAKGIVWAADSGANIINLSLTFTEPSPTLENAIGYAWDKGVVIIAAAGNNYSSTPVYPAAYPNTIAVAATDKNDHLPRWSNHGDWVSLGAPGTDICSTLPNDNYGYRSGTSLATALVSGEAALLFTTAIDANSNGYINDEVRDRIESNCDGVETEGLGEGRINALKAARAVRTVYPVKRHPLY